MILPSSRNSAAIPQLLLRPGGLDVNTSAVVVRQPVSKSVVRQLQHRAAATAYCWFRVHSGVSSLYQQYTLVSAGTVPYSQAGRRIMARIQFASLCATLYMICSQAASANRPNVLFIISDDLGWGEVGIYSSTPLPRRISTPNIDALLTSGVRFTSAYSGSPVCAPSRNALLVGQHTGHSE